MREPFSFNHFDWDVSLDGSLPGAYGGTDFDNRGTSGDQGAATVNGFLYAHAGAQAQVGQFGASLTAEFFQYDIHADTTRDALTLVYGRFHALAGYGFADNQIVVGGGARIVTLALKEHTNQFQQIAGGRTLVSLDGVAPEFGAVIKPNNFPLRLGATFRLPVEGTQSTGTTTTASTVVMGAQRAGDYIVPQKAVLPWELEMGFALQLGPRPLNPTWLAPHDMEAQVRDRIDEARARRRRDHEASMDRASKAERPALTRDFAREDAAIRAVEDQRLDAEIDRLHAVRKAREENWPRERILLVGALLLSGSSDEAVALEGFATQQRELVGRKVSLSPRAGLESEPIPDLLHGRVGTYLEPSRFDDGSLRQHFTFGADVKLFRIAPFGLFDETLRVTLSADLAPRYQNFGLGVGAWH